MFNSTQPRRVGDGYGAQPAPQQPPPGRGQSPVQAVNDQLGGLIDDARSYGGGAAQAAPLAHNEVWLSKPYQAHDVQVQRVKFREPTGKEYRQFGVPVRYVTSDGAVSETSIVVNMDVVANYVMALSDPPIPSTTVDRMSVEDLNACSRVITGFFT